MYALCPTVGAETLLTPLSSYGLHSAEWFRSCTSETRPTLDPVECESSPVVEITTVDLTHGTNCRMNLFNLALVVRELSDEADLVANVAGPLQQWPLADSRFEIPLETAP